MEIWKVIESYPTYEASSLGRIRSLKWKDKDGNPTIMSSQKESDGRLRTSIRYKRKKKRVLLHRMVAEAFLGVCPKNKTVNHKNGNVEDNRPDNLEYVTPRENYDHAVKMGLTARGAKHPQAFLTDEIVLEIREDLKSLCGKAVAEKYNLSYSHLYAIKTRKLWKHL